MNFSIKVSLTKQKLLSFAFGLFFLSLNFEKLVFFRLPGTSTHLKFAHIVGALLLLYIIINRRIYKPPVLILLYFTISIGISLWAYSFYGFNGLILNYIFSFFVFFCAYQFSFQLEREEILQTIRICVLFIYAAVLIKLFINYDGVISRNYNGLPLIPYFYGGGRNLEASWLACFVIFFLRSRWYYYLLFISFVISIIYLSRTAFLLNIIVLAYPHLSKFFRNPIMFIFGIFGFLTVSGMLYVYLQDSIIFERFFSIGKEAGSIGRLQMWKHFDTAFIENLWGYGAGNSMIAIRAFSDIPLDSPAIHNVYLQTALDLGIFGIICYLTLCILVVLQEFKTNWSCPLGAFIMLYLVASLTQFRGAENLLWFIAGIYIIHSRRTTPSTSQITNEYSTSH